MILLCSQGCRWGHVSDHKCQAEKMKLSFKAAKVDVQWTFSWSGFAKQLLTSLEMALAVSYLPPNKHSRNDNSQLFWQIFLPFPFKTPGYDDLYLVVLVVVYTRDGWGAMAAMTAPRTEAPQAQLLSELARYLTLFPWHAAKDSCTLSIVNNAVCCPPVRVRIVRVYLGALK